MLHRGGGGGALPVPLPGETIGRGTLKHPGTTIMALLDFSITPLGAGESVSPFVARAVDVIDRSGLNYRLHAMGTEVEGNLDQLLDLLKQCIDVVIQDCDRVSVSAKLDYRKGRSGALDAKVASVERRLGRPIQK